MPLRSGDKLGPYEILAPLGAGGMGEVYRARDTKLKREVALKVLPEVFAGDPDRMARFQREAEVLASLNHSNIAAIYGVEERALIMELVEGENLNGPLSLETALNYAKQITDALEAAHEKGIVHRDLKPANIKVTPQGVVKVLDFGLAAIAQTSAGDASNPANSPTLTISPTRAGMILGTAAYMSPEQARGMPVDKRADIWAFGAVLYEMLTGKQLFHGDTVSDILASVLKEQPDLTRVPPQIRRLLQACLQKDPKERLQAIGDWRLLLVPEDGTAPSRSRLGLVASIAAAVFALVAAALVFIHFRENPPVAQVVRFQIPLPEGSNRATGAYVSPDGRRIAFPATGQSGRTVIWIHSLDSLESRPLAGTEGVLSPLIWSPDVVFTVQGKVKKVAASGGPPQTVCDLPGAWRGAGWSRDGVIALGVEARGLMRIPDTGGAASPLTTLDTSRQETAHGSPSFLPDGRHFVYIRRSRAVGESGIYLGSLDAKPEQQDSKRLVATDSTAIYAPSSDPDWGHLLFVREGSLVAQAFDVRRLELAGEAVPIAEGLPLTGPALFSASANGVLAYATGGVAGTITTQLTWFDRSGKLLGTAGEPGEYTVLTLSPDGTRVAVSRIDPQAAGTGSGGWRGNTDIWVHEFSRETSGRLTFDPATDTSPVWSPDGSRIIFSSDRDGLYNLYQKMSSGAGNEEALLKSNETKYAYDWSQDGRFLLFVAPQKDGLWVLPLTGEDRKPIPYLTEANASQARFSADSRWIAYTSGESGKSEDVPCGVGRQVDHIERRRHSASLAAGWQGVVLHFPRFQTDVGGGNGCLGDVPGGQSQRCPSWAETPRSPEPATTSPPTARSS
jgi:Tol biopolymer transport system component/predicted Ser/Thr protein kinase